MKRSDVIFWETISCSIELPSFMTQWAFTCSKLTIETLEQGVKLFKVNNKDTRMTPMERRHIYNKDIFTIKAPYTIKTPERRHTLHLVLVFLLLTLNV